MIIRKREQAERDRQEYEKKRPIYLEQYGHMFMSELVHIPRDTVIGKDGYPKIKGAEGWGERYTVYISNTGNTVHRTKGCSRANKPIHILKASGYSKCKRCFNEPLPQFPWLEKYKEIKEICSKYNVKMFDDCTENGPPVLSNMDRIYHDAKAKGK